MMLGFFLRFRQSIILFVLLLVSLVLMTSHAKRENEYQELTAGLLEVTASLGTGLSSLTQGTINLYKGYVDLRGVRVENLRFREQTALLENKLNRLHEVEVENRRLMELLEFQESLPFVMTPARVVGKDFNSWSRTLIISEGENAGIETGMAVVRPEGVVGRIFSVSPNYALVQLIIDSNSDIPAVFQRTRAQGIVEGKITDQCQVKYLNRLADIQVDDPVISSGLGGAYPKGLLIGTVASIQKKPYGLFQEVTVTPAVDFTRIEEVLVVKNIRSEEYDLQLKRLQE
jgi:rod shape-determining protein MreC